ncbi:MAG TPA: GTP-binding protein [Holophagaceae bacterium]|jgi:sulfate adenylyltransferase subunit 1|nr:GTP-binding protein [Holophagaceae bacterium]
MTTPITHDLPALRFLACGSVDDGKSTLLGRLLHDAGAIPPDALEAARCASRERGLGELDCSLLTDGLLSEREQGITIDVAYRYFGSGNRRFILADTPGHAQYTRNMATAASTADLAILLVDARKGILPQTRRHAALAHLLGVRRLVVAVNKLDALAWSRDAFARVREDFGAFASTLGISGADFIPVSALHGDMVVARGSHLDWYTGPTLLEALERTAQEDARSGGPFRFPVQLVRRHEGERRYLGRVESGAVRVGDEVAAWPSGFQARVKRLELGGVPLETAVAGQSIALQLHEDVDLPRGGLLTDPASAPDLVRAFDATLCWFGEQPLDLRRRYGLHLGPAETQARVEGIAPIAGLEAPGGEPHAALETNGLALARIVCRDTLAADPYDTHRAGGAFILVDETTNAPVAAGMIRRAT